MKFRPAEFLVIIGILLVLGCCLVPAGLDAILAIPLLLAFGWTWFLARVLAEIQIDISATLTALVCLVLLAVGLHRFCGWLTAHVRKLEEGSPPRPWRWRWTLALLGVVVLMFVAGISAVGITHQTSWLMSESLTERASYRILVERMETSNQLKQIGIALHAHHDSRQNFPAGAIFDDRGNALHGWQTAILPYIEQDALYKEIDQKLPWNHAKNAPHFKMSVFVYYPVNIDSEFDKDGFALSGFASNVRVMGGNVALSLKDIPDGTSHTILAGQVGANHKPWGYPLGWRDPALGINQSPHGFGNLAKTGAVFVFADGHVKFLSNNVSPEVLKALSTPAGGEKVKEVKEGY